MNKIERLENSSSKTDLKNDNNHESNNKINKNTIKDEKVLCNHCGRTVENGIRCQGICVTDNEY